MQQFTLELFRKHDTGYDLRILQQQTLLTTHWVAQSDMDALLTATAQHYTLTAHDLQQRGQVLFNWINQHSHGWLREVRTHHPSLALTIDVREAGLGHLPWELLHDGDQYLCAHPLHLFTPLRRVTPAERQHNWQPEKRQLGVLFMASAPEDLSPQLDFEAEEAGILHATARKPLDLQVEESGSLSGLEQRLDQYEQSPDVIHLSGHAGIDEQQQPQFFLEDDIGNTAPASPLAFACCLRDGNAQPKLVFLSGCRTGESTLQENVLSFSEQLVDAGVPVVLGWALPVGDQAASQTAAMLYEKLAKGFGISEAVAQCRQQLLENNSPYWHLLRCYVDGSPLQPLVKKGHLRIRPHNTSQEFLDAASGQRLPVCSRTEFIGRRRLLQRCLKSLRAYSGCEDYAEGVLLYGMGGLGKSSAAARIIDRLRNHYQPIIIYGGLDETVLLSALDNALSSPEPSVQTLLNHPSLDLEGRLQALFQAENNPYCQKPLLLVLDDFEQNIPKQQRGNAQANYQPDALRVLNAIVQAIHRSQSDSRLIITSRYDVPVSAPCCLHKENPLTLRDSDLGKKLAQLPNLQISATANDDTDEHRESHLLRLRAIEIAAGNPRLLEWLDKVLADGQDRLSIPALLRKLENKQAEFREAVLVADLVSAQEKKVQKTLACASLYQVPVTLDAITALRNTPDAAQHLQTAAQLGLIEITKHGGNTTYFVSNLLDAVLEDQLDLATTKTLAAKAAQHLYNALDNQASETWRLEIVRLARLGMQQAIAVEVGDLLAHQMIAKDRYREAEALCHQLLSLGEISTTLRLLSQAEFRLGNGEQGVEHIERAVALLPADKDSLNDQKLKESALTLGALADILQARGQLDDALRIRKNEELPVYEKLGDVREKAVTMGQIADILQARGQLDDALKTLQDEVLPAFEKLGDVRSKAVTMGQIADILQARGQLDDALKTLQDEVLPAFEKLGDVRSKAVTMGKIADILQARGQLDDALRLRKNEELPVYEKLGDVRSKAVTMGQIADILQARGQLDDALRIRQNEQLPVYEKLGDVRSKAVTMGKIADILQARGQLDDALRIRQNEQLPVYEKLGDVRSKAVTMGKIADILQARGQLDDALKTLQDEVLPAFEKLGDVRSKAVTMGKIADILQARGQLDDALRIRQNEQLPVYEKLGDVREKAVTMGQIADILQARGQLDDALRIRQNEQLPVYEKLGDVREKAVTMGQIADILQARGQLDDALRIRKNEELPVYEKLGDVRSKAVTMGQIADILQARGQLDDALKTLQDEVLPAFEKLGDVRSKAVTMGQIADILQARGQLDDALKTLQDEVLPAFEKLGDVRSKAVTMGKIADILQARGQLDDALVVYQDNILICEKLDDIEGKAYGIAKIANILWIQNPSDNAETVRTYLLKSLAIFQQMQLPRETEWVENLLKNTGLPLKGMINPKLSQPIIDGEVYYPKQYSHLFTQDINQEQRLSAGLKHIEIEYYSGTKQVTLWTGLQLAKNNNISETNLDEFTELLITSISLNTSTEKAQVFESYSTLSQEQISALVHLLKEEQMKLSELGKQHPNDTDMLQDKAVKGWLIWEETKGCKLDV